MKRAKAPPHPAVVAECAVIADMLALGRRDEIIEFAALHLAMPDLIIRTLTNIAISEYMRLFPPFRKQNECPWIEEPLTETQTRTRTGSRVPKGTSSSSASRDNARAAGQRVRNDLSLEWFEYSETLTVSTGETDFQCLFCRKSLNTLPRGKAVSWNSQFIKDIREHGEECGIRMLAGLMKPHRPLPKGQPGL